MSSGCGRPGTSTIGQPSRKRATGSAASVADITTTRRSSRAVQACRASASPRSAWMDRSWNSSRTIVRTPESSGSSTRRAVRMPSVASRTRVAAVNRRSKRTCQPTSWPSVQPRSSAIRRAMARAATRRGCSTSTGPSAASAGGSRVVLPAPGGATTTAARCRRTASTTASTCASIGSGSRRTAPQAEGFAGSAPLVATAAGAAAAARIDAQRTTHAATRLTAPPISDSTATCSFRTSTPRSSATTGMK